MAHLISREINSKRIFPEITPSLYQRSDDQSNPTPEQSAAASMLRLPAEPLTRWQKYARLRMDPISSAARALLLHSKAFESEQAAQWRRADFFWRELYDELDRLCVNDESWRALAASLAVRTTDGEVSLDPSKLRSAFIEELLIDTHAAFFNGYQKAAEPPALDSRGWVHLDYINKAFEWSDLSSRQKLRLIEAATQERMRLLADANRWDEAIQHCSLLLQYDPESFDYLEQNFSLALDLRISHFSRNGRLVSGNDYSALIACIRDFQMLQKQYSRNALIYQKLADLYHQMAIGIANAGSVSVALEVAQRAATFNPSSIAIASYLIELTERMNSLKEEAKDLAPHSTVRLGHSGAFLLDEARIGFSLLEQYKESEEATQTTEAVRVASALLLWRKMGLARPEDSWSERACRLLDVVDLIDDVPPATALELRATWRRLAENDQDLAQLDRDRVYSFLEQKYGLMARSTSQSNRPADNAPCLVPASSQPKQLGEPFDFWLFGRKDMRVKLQAAAAILLLMAVTAVVIRETRARSIRDESYQSIRHGLSSRNHLQVIEGAETFLSHPLVVAADSREDEVVKLYSESLVLWVAHRPGAINPETAAHVERYRQLVGNRNGGGL